MRARNRLPSQTLQKVRGQLRFQQRHDQPYTIQTGHLRLLVTSIVILAGCFFDLPDVRYSPVAYEAIYPIQHFFTLAEDVYIPQASCWYSRTLRKNTRWELVGRFAGNEVFRSREQTFTIECTNTYEAYIVKSENQLIGFFLPVQNGFVKLGNPISLVTSK
jgi:hypothetical protein